MESFDCINKGICGACEELYLVQFVPFPIDLSVVLAIAFSAEERRVVVVVEAGVLCHAHTHPKKVEPHQTEHWTTIFKRGIASIPDKNSV